MLVYRPRPAPRERRCHRYLLHHGLFPFQGIASHGFEGLTYWQIVRDVRLILPCFSLKVGPTLLAIGRKAGLARKIPMIQVIGRQKDTTIDLQSTE